MSLRFKQRLAQIKDSHPDVIEEVRGEGLLLGLKLKVPNREFMAALRDAGLLTVAGGENTLRILPPLIVSEDEMAEGLTILDRVAGSFEAKTAAAM